MVVSKGIFSCERQIRRGADYVVMGGKSAYQGTSDLLWSLHQEMDRNTLYILLW